MSGGEFGRGSICLKVAPIKPYLFPLSISRHAPLIDPPLLHFSHGILHLSSDLLEFFQSSGHLGYWTVPCFPISAGVDSHQKIEWGLPCRGILSIVMRKLRQGEVLRPVILLIVYEEPEISFEPLIGSF